MSLATLLIIAFKVAIIGSGAFFVTQERIPQETPNQVGVVIPLETKIEPVPPVKQPEQKGDKKKLADGSLKGFQPLAVGQTISSREHLGGYVRDDSGVYMLNINGPGNKVAAADAATFEVSAEWPIYGRDASHVYVYDRIIAGADPGTFVPLCGNSISLESFCAYGKDTRHVYAFTKIIAEADPATFVSLISNNDANRNFAGKSWTGAAIDASAFYTAHVPMNYGDLDGELIGSRITKLSDGTPIHFSDTTKVIAINSNNASWGGYHEGLKIGSKSYYGGYYFVDGSAVYTAYSACDVDSAGTESNCTFTLSRVEKVGDRPAGL